MYKKVLSLCVIIGGHTIQATEIIAGDTSGQQSFSFPINTHIYEPLNGFLVVGAAAPITTSATAAQYAIAACPLSSSQFFPQISAGATTINGQAAANPLLGAQINALSLMFLNPLYPSIVAVPATTPGIAYLFPFSTVAQTSTTFALLSTQTLLDATGQPTPFIAALTTNQAAVPLAQLGMAKSRPAGLLPGMALFAAVAPHASGTFGQTGSGLAGAVLVQPNGQGPVSFQQLMTAPLDTTALALRIGDTLTSLTPHVSMTNVVSTFTQPNITLSTVYVGVQGQAGPLATDGMQAVAMVSGTVLTGSVITQNPIAVTKIAPDSAITSDSIISATGALATVNIYQLAGMQSTMQLRYLIVVGGVAPQATKRSVFALPLVSETGVLANVNVAPTVIFGDQPNYFFLGRTLPAATAPGDLYTTSSPQAIVGGSVQLPGDVTDIVASGDSVFASIMSSTTALPGTFYSQALFDNTGRIQGWTNWQRVGNDLTGTLGVAADATQGKIWSLIGTSSTTVNTVQRTVWEPAAQGPQQFINQTFDPIAGGIQGLFDFPQQLAAFSQNNPLALLVATGNNQVVVAQSGQTSAGIFTPTTDFSNVYAQTNGTLQGFVPGVHALVLSGGALANLGSITSAAILTDGTSGWLAVAGAQGLAVLARPDGTGWPLSSGLQSGFVGLTADMAWVQVGSYNAVRKLVAQQGQLYILTQTTLERLTITPHQFTAGAAAASVLLAQGGSLPGGLHYFLSDVIISQKVALLGTSSGLLRAGNGTDITTATNSTAVGWTPIPLSFSAGPVSRFYAISPTGIETDVVQTSPQVSGNVYVLDGYVGYSQARVYRFTFSYTGAITDTTVQQIPDVIVGNSGPTYFLSFGRYRNYMAMDGSFFGVSRSKYRSRSTLFEVLPPSWMLGISQNLIAQATNVFKDEETHHIGQMIRSSVTGAWLLPGEFGLFTNE